jgi:hypothetical protein
MGAGLLACTLSGGAGATSEAPAATPAAAELAIGAPASAFDTFLDRLMRSESNGQDNAKNPRSTALGAFQFIKSTFLDVMRRNFAGDVANMSEGDILALRTDRGFARRAAEAFSKENLDYLTDRGLQPTFGHLRLAFLLGPVGAARVMEAPPAKPVAAILNDSVIAANPFMRRMSAADLIARAHRDVGATEAPARQVAEVTAPQAAVEAAAPQGDGETAAQQAAVEAPAPQAAETAAQQAAPEAAAAKPAQPEESRPRVAAAPPAAKTPARAVAARSDRGRASSRTAVINVTCNPKLASCQRWIDRQVAKVAGVPGHGGA